MDELQEIKHIVAISISEVKKMKLISISDNNQYNCCISYEQIKILTWSNLSNKLIIQLFP